MTNFRKTFLSRSAVLVYVSLALSLLGRLGTIAWQHNLTAMSGTALTLATVVLFLDMREGRDGADPRWNKL